MLPGMRKRDDPPDLSEADIRESPSLALATIYKYLTDLYHRMGTVEGRQGIVVALLLAILTALISVAVKVFTEG